VLNVGTDRIDNADGTGNGGLHRAFVKCVSRHPGRAEDDGIDHRRRLCPVGAVLCRNAFHQLLQCNQSGAAATEIEFSPFINCHSATSVAPPRPKSNYDPRRRPVIARYLSPFRGFLAPKNRRQETNPVLILGRTFLAIRCPVHSVNRVPLHIRPAVGGAPLSYLS
jgi:hypothetical protein